MNPKKCRAAYWAERGIERRDRQFIADMVCRLRDKIQSCRVRSLSNIFAWDNFYVLTYGEQLFGVADDAAFADR